MLGGIEQKNMRVVVYARVSSEDQAERGTIESQIEFARKYCDLHEIDVLDWYLDDGITGTLPLDDRPEGQRLREDAHAGKFDLVLIYKLDRLGRSARIIINSVYDLEQHGVKIRSMTEPFDTSTPAGRFTLNVLASVADLERETMLERMWHGANRAARAGKWLGGIVPYGYYVEYDGDDGYLAINEERLPGVNISEADVVRMIYQMSAGRGLSCIAIADYLNAIGVPPSYIRHGRKVRRGKRKENTAGIWHPSRIRNMIVNTTYAGVHEYGKRSNKDREIIRREVPAIVDQDTWARAQQVLQDNAIEAIRNTKYKYLLRGLIKCGECGLNYNGAAYPRKDDIAISYRCNGKQSYRGPKQGRCTSLNVPGDWLEEIIWQDCINFIEHPGEAICELEQSMSDRKERKADTAAELQLVKRAMLDKENEKQAVLDLFRRKLINSSDVEAQLGKIAQELSSIEHVAAGLEKELLVEVELLDRFASAGELLADLRAKLTDNPTWETKREIVQTLVREIIVHTDNTGTRPQMRIEARFVFTRVANRTDIRADYNSHDDVRRCISKKREMATLDSAGARLWTARRAARLDIKTLASMASMHPQSIIDVELGRTKPTIKLCRGLAPVLGVAIAHLGAYDKMPARTLAQRIKKARYFHGLLIKEAAAQLGVDHTTFRNWEHGQAPRSHNMDRLLPFLMILEN